MAVQIPAKKPYRVSVLGATYIDPVEGIGPTGEKQILYVHRVGRQGETIQLTEEQAQRLEDLNAVKPADSPLGYQEQNEKELSKLAEERGVVVRGSGVDGAVLRADLLTALENHDRATQSQELALRYADEARERTDAQAKASTAAAKREK